MKLFRTETYSYEFPLTAKTLWAELMALRRYGWRIETIIPTSETSATFFVKRRRWFWQGA